MKERGKIFQGIAFWLLLTVLPAAAFTQSFPVLKWQKFYGTDFDDMPSRLLKLPDGNLALGGNALKGDGATDCTQIFIVKVDTNGNKLWERRIGGTGCEELKDMVVSMDGGIIFAGVTSSFITHPEKGEDHFKGDYFIGKLTPGGEVEWMKTYGGLDLDMAYGIARSYGWPEYVVAGVSNSTNFDVQTSLEMANLWCVQIDELGNKRTAWSFGGTRHDWAYSIAACEDGDFVFAGFTNSEDIDGIERRQNGDGWVGRFDRYGALEWQKIYSGKLEDFFTRVIVDKDGRIVLTGNFESESNGKQFWFLKLSSDGQKIYERIFGAEADEYATSIAPCEDGGYILTGYSKYIKLSNKYIKGGEDFWVFRLNYAGEIIWTNTFGGRDDERGIDIIEYSPGVYYALGVKRNNFAVGGVKDTKNDYWLLKINEKQCDNVDIKIYTSLKDNTGYAKTNIKFKAIVNKGERFLWDFGDGTTSEEQDPVKKYDLPGVYEIKLTVYQDENCQKTYRMPEYLMIW